MKNALVLFIRRVGFCIVAAYLKDNGYSLKAGVFVNRGQSNYQNEFAAAYNVSEYLRIPLFLADFSLPDLKKVLSEDMRKKMGIPARNLILGVVALPYVYALDCEVLVLGNIISDDFPDCNQDFRSKFSAVASQSLNKRVDVIAPMADVEGWDKADEISFANRSGYHSLFNITWTCWLGGKFHCGHCDACKWRKDGFKKAGIVDPVIYEKNEK